MAESEPQPNATTRPLSRKRATAALLVAADDLTDEAIAAEIKVDKTTLERWKRKADFRAAVEAHLQTWAAELKGRGLAEKQNRIDALNERALRLQRVMDARAAAHADVPGGDTGLLVATPMLVKVYEGAETDQDEGGVYPTKEARIVYVYAIDAVLLKEMREHEKQAAQELGQWVEKRGIEHSGTVLIREYQGVPEDFV